MDVVMLFPVSAKIRLTRLAALDIVCLSYSAKGASLNQRIQGVSKEKDKNKPLSKKKPKRKSKLKDGSEPEWARLPLLSNHEITFVTDGYGDAEKFARIFNNTWDCLPEEHQGYLLEHWQLHSTPLLKYPVVQLIGWKKEFMPVKRHDTDDPDVAAFAACTENGLQFAFWQPVMDRLPDEHAETIVAHELAHAVISILPENRENPQLDVLIMFTI